MTKDQLQAELKEKVKEGVKPSEIRSSRRTSIVGDQLKKLKKSKSLDDLPTSPPNPPLKKSQSQLEIPLPPNLKQQISSLQDELTTERKKVNLLREDLNQEQEKNKQLKEKITQLEDQILQLRLDKIKDFADYLDKKDQLETELEQNIQAGTQEIEKLENKLKTVNQQKTKLQSQLTKSPLTPNNLAPTFNYWPIVLTFCLALWLLKK